MKASRAGKIAVALSLLALACGGSDGVSADDSGNGANGANNGGQGQASNGDPLITISGTVYGSANTGVGCSPACSFSNPLAGATVSTSLDGVTATTDSQGRFTLVTNTRTASRCIEYSVQITAYAYTPYKVTGAWGNLASGKSFSMSPPIPTAVPTC